MQLHHGSCSVNRHHISAEWLQLPQICRFINVLCAEKYRLINDRVSVFIAGEEQNKEALQDAEEEAQ